jgi:hypothetical protein
MKSLNERARLAFSELKKIGAPVLHFGEGYGGNGLFAISAEMNDDELWADMYFEGFDFGVNPIIESILEKYGLFCEWYNPGVLDVYED